MVRWIRRSDHPNRPKAMTCCFFWSFKTLLTSTEGTVLASESTSWVMVSLAGFQVIISGRFWVITEALGLGDSTRSEEVLSLLLLPIGAALGFFGAILARRLP